MGTSTGISGLPYELWKVLNDKYETDTKEHRPTFNLIKAFTKVFIDIEEYGVIPTTNFAEG